MKNPFGKFIKKNDIYGEPIEKPIEIKKQKEKVYRGHDYIGWVKAHKFNAEVFINPSGMAIYPLSITVKSAFKERELFFESFKFIKRMENNYYISDSIIFKHIRDNKYIAKDNNSEFLTQPKNLMLPSVLFDNVVQINTDNMIKLSTMPSERSFSIVLKDKEIEFWKAQKGGKLGVMF